LEAVGRVLFAELLEPGHLDLARLAVSAPEVEDQRAALEVAEGDFVAVQIEQGECGGGLAAELGLAGGENRSRPGWSCRA